jgi:NADH-quinone oxidoreductase subunit N
MRTARENRTVNDITKALTGFLPAVLPEAILGVMACVLFLGATWKRSRNLWGVVALLALGLAGVGLWQSRQGNTEEAIKSQIAELYRQGDAKSAEAREAELRAIVYASPVQNNYLASLLKVVALVAGAVLVLFSWDEMPASHAAEYHGCLLVMIAGACLVGAANDLITLFLALELISIPTYVMLYLPRSDSAAQEAAMKYFLLSVFSSALLLFGFSYLYGLTGTTNLPALVEALIRAGRELRIGDEVARRSDTWQGMALLAVLLVLVGLGFRITAVPFHFYAPDVYQGTSTGMAALLSFIPKAAGFAALIRILGFVPSAMSGPRSGPEGVVLADHLPVLLWIIAAVSMSLGNLLALLQDNVKRLLAYSSVAHAGYMLIGLTVAPWLLEPAGALVGGVEAVLFYLVAYGAMTVGAFAILHYLDVPERPVQTMDDLAGVGRSNPGMALVMTLFLFSLIGIPLTAGFTGKFLLFFDALGVPGSEAGGAQHKLLGEMAYLYRVLAVIAVVNAAVGSWYYLRIIAVLYLREPLHPAHQRRSAPLVMAILICAALTLGLGVYPPLLLAEVQKAVPRRATTLGVGPVPNMLGDRAGIPHPPTPSPGAG